MKNKFKLFGFSVLLSTVIVITSAGNQQQNEKNQKAQNQDKQDKQDKKDKPAQAGRNNKPQNAGQQNKPDAPGKSNERGKSDERDNRGNSAANKNENNNDGNNKNAKYVMTDGFRWDRETFKDRDKYRKQEKVTICHKVNNGAEPAVTISVSSNALKAHMNHGDVMGDCPEVNNSPYSNVFLRNRTDYYNTLQNHYEQVTYSQSILDYARSRLTNSRQQLIVMQNNNVPAAEIERKQAAVIDLEQNVSLLESLIGVAANLVVNKLNN